MKSRKTRAVQHALLRCRGKLHVQCHKRGSGERNDLRRVRSDRSRHIVAFCD